MKKAIVIIACERDLYFKQCVDAVLANNLDGWDIIVSLDGNKNLDYFKTLIDAKFIVNESPLGAGKHIITMKQNLFKEYDYILQIEDDIVTAPTFVETSWLFMQWAESTYDNVGSVSTSNYTHGDTEHKKNKLGVFGSYPSGASTAIMSKKTWSKIEPYMLEYLSLLPSRYELRSGVIIGAWMKAVCEKIKPNLTPKSYSLGCSEEYFTQTDCFSQDKAHACALYINGLVSLITYVPYCKNIGAIGMHSNLEFYQKSVLPTIELNYFDIPTEFISL